MYEKSFSMSFFEQSFGGERFCSNFKMATSLRTEKPQPILAYLRVRPVNRQERDQRATTCIEVVGPKEVAVKQQHGKKYLFDKVFGPSSKQIEIYKTVVEPLIAEVIAGYNCTVFAYGQTGTGKTYTMAGGSATSPNIPWQDDKEAGIIPRCLAHLFDELRLVESDYTVRVSYLELYNEELFDLLSESDDPARIRLFENHRQKGSVIIEGIEEITVCNKNEVYKILEKGQIKRRTASTLMNDQSSRSHTVFCITVHIRETTIEGEQLVKTGKMNLVDLAGSENISRSGAVDRRAREAGSINQSLLTLGRVIKALVEKSAHVPYRESKLTRILQDSLGGRTKTSIIATISPASCSSDESISTLDYANRARNITNRPEVNMKMTQKCLLNHYTEEINRLRKDLNAMRSGTGIYLDQGNYDRLMADQQIQKEEIMEKIVMIRTIEQQLKNLEDEKAALEKNWDDLMVSFETTQNELHSCREKLSEETTKNREHEHLLSRYEETEEKLKRQAETLLDVVQHSTKNESKLHEKVNCLYGTSFHNQTAINNLLKYILNKSDIANKLTTDFKQAQKLNKKNLLELMQKIAEEHEQTKTLMVENSRLYHDTCIKATSELNSMAESKHLNDLTTLNNMRELTNSMSNYKGVVDQINQENVDKITALQNLMLLYFEKEVGFVKEVEKNNEDVHAIVDRGVSLVQENLRKLKEDCRATLEMVHEHVTVENMCIEENVNECKLVENMCYEMLSKIQGIQRHLGGNIGSNNKFIETVREMNDNVQHGVAVTEQELGDVLEKVNSSRMGSRELLEARQRDEEELKHNLAQAVDEAHMDHKRIPAYFETFTKFVQEDTAKICSKALDDNDKYIQQHKLKVTDFQNSAEISETERIAGIASLAGCITKGAVDVSAVMRDTTKSVVVQSDKVAETWAKCKQKIKAFQKQELINVSHGGDTPGRRQYEYPRTIIEMSPRERILERFRQSRAHTQIDQTDENNLSWHDTEQELIAEEVGPNILSTNLQNIKSVSSENVPVKVEYQAVKVEQEN